MSSIFVTSHLVLGDKPTTVSGTIIEVTSAEDAVRVIENDGTAVLPAGAWDKAEEVLRLFGADEGHIRFQISLARGHNRDEPKF